MQLSSSTTPFRVVALLAVLILALGAAIAATSQEIPPAKYSAEVFPGHCEADEDCTLTFTITNASPPDSGHIMTDASITVPAGFTLKGAGDVETSTVELLPLEKSWTATPSGSTVFLTADELTDGLAPQESLSVPVEVFAPLALLGPDHEFSTDALTAVGTEFTLLGDEPSVDVVNDEAQCDPGFDCETTTVTLKNTSAKAEASVGGTLQFLTLSVGGSFSDSTNNCLASAPTFDPVGEAVTSALTQDDPPDRSHIVTLTLDKTVDNSAGAPGAERIDICAASDKPFKDKDGEDAVFNEGTGFYEGILPNCPVPLLPTTTKCVLDRSRKAGKAVIRYYVEPGDPISIPGLDGLS